MRMVKIDPTPIYYFFMKKTFLWSLVSGMYIPTPFLTRHYPTPQKIKRYQSIKNQTSQKKKCANLARFSCPVVSCYD